MTIARPTHRRTNFAPAPEKYDANDQLAFRREVELHIQQIGSVTPFGPYYAIQANELGVQSTGFPVGHVHRYGAVGNGTTDDASAFLAAIAFAPEYSTITGVAGASYAVSRSVQSTKTLLMAGQGATLVAVAAMDAIGYSTDVDGMHWRDWNLDGGGLAKSGIKSLADTVDVEGFTAFNCHATNLARDIELYEAALRVTSSATMTARHKNVQVHHCSGIDCETAGLFIYYADGVSVSNWTGRNLDNHSYELVNCTDFVVNGVRSSYCGGSGAAAGAQCYHGVMSNIIIDHCIGDAGITVENTSADVRVSNFEIRDSWKAALSANYGEAGNPFPNDVMRGIHYSNGTARAAAPVAITGATKSYPCKLTVPNHGIKTIYLSNTVQVSISGVVGMTALNGLTPQITTVDPSHIDPVTHRPTGTHDPDHIWLCAVDTSTGLLVQVVDSTLFGAYTSGGTIAPFCNGANMYGGVPAVSPNCGITDVHFDDFNCGPAMLYMKESVCRNVTVSGLQGPRSAVGRFTYFTHGQITGLRNVDQNHQPNDPLGAIQFLVQTGTASGCDRVTVTDADVLQCGSASNYPFAYIEGNGDFTFNVPTTGGASCVTSTRAGDSPTIRINRPSVALSTDTLYTQGAGASPTYYIDWPRLPRTITVTSTGVYYDSVIRADATAGAVDYTPSNYASVVGQRVSVIKVDATANLVTAFGKTLAAHLDSVEAEATPNGWYVV